MSRGGEHQRFVEDLFGPMFDGDENANSDVGERPDPIVGIHQLALMVSIAPAPMLTQRPIWERPMMMANADRMRMAATAS